MLEVYEGQDNVDPYDFMTLRGHSVDVKTGFRNIHTRLLVNVEQFYNLIFNSLVAKNRYNLPFYGIYSGFFFFTLFGNLFPAFTFFLNVFHPAFRDELVVCPETAGIMQGIGQLVTFI